MNVSVEPSSQSWVDAAVGDLPTLLCDHAHCEKKAAHTALRFIFRYPENGRLVAQLSRLAREELLHFERVLSEMNRLHLPFRSLASANYAAELFTASRRPRQAPLVLRQAQHERVLMRSRLVDELLVCALIEARSHERFERLIGAIDDPALRDFYVDLAEAEARHGELYIGLAEEHAPASIVDRLEELKKIEGTIVARPSQPLRMHAGG